MSLTQEASWPQPNELVVAVVDELVDHGAYVKLETHPGRRGYLPISEISQGWVTDIRRFVNPGQRVVLRVIRVNPSKGHIDLSLKRVAQSERSSLLKSWKRQKRFIKTVEGFFAAEKLSKEEREAVLSRLLTSQDPLGVLEKAASEGEAPLVSVGIDRETASRLSEYAKKIVKLKEYTGCVKFRLFTPGEAGADRIRSALQDIEKYLSGKGVKPKVYVVAAPRYAAEFTSDKPKLVNLVMKEAAEEVVRAAKQWRLEASVEG